MRVLAVAVSTVVGAADLKGCLGPAEPTRVHLTFPAGPGDRGVEWIGCADWSVEDEGDGSYLVEPGWTRCAVAGWRRDGLLTVRTENVPLHAGASFQHVDFDLPRGPIGGLGVEVRGTCAGMRVMRVVEGSPAGEAGLLPGVDITAVDGVPTRHMPVREFVRRATGEPGSIVEIEVADPEGRWDVAIAREPVR